MSALARRIPLQAVMGTLPALSRTERHAVLFKMVVMDAPLLIVRLARERIRHGSRHAALTIHSHT